MMEHKKKKVIDISEVIHSKNPKLLKILPRFALEYVKRIIHEDDMNSFLDMHGHKHEFDFIHAIIETFKIKVPVKGLENIPAHGGFIMASNHPLGGFDAIALMHVVSRKRKDVKFIVNDILMQLKNLKGLFTGVNKHGKNAAESLARIDKLYASEQGVLIFPAGLVSRKQNGVIKDLEWKKSFITKAKKYQRDIIPVHIEGGNTNRFYNLANWRKTFGIKANIEMFFLVDEMYKQENKTISITIGEPISYSVFDKRFSDYDWAEKLKAHVYALKSNESLVFSIKIAKSKSINF